MTRVLISLTLWTVGCAEVEQSSSCATYVACIQAKDDVDGVETDLDRFEPDGACWGSPEGASLCDRACVNGLDWMQGAYADLPEECAE